VENEITEENIIGLGWMNASVIVVIFAWLYLTWRAVSVSKETMEARRPSTALA
jgi:hypothetical protein